MARKRVSSQVNLPPFQALLDAHGADVHRFLIATVGRVDADDCYQETWLAALRAYPRLRDASNLRSWVFTIAHRKAIDQIRSRTRAAVPVGGPEDLDTGAGDAEPTLPDGIWSRVARLPAKQRTALALRFVTDAAYAEIAAVMQTSEEAARRNVHEGLKRLRKEYA
jgi:DNA-directed RNA polymerase specialized sigma24 family protein